jgi:hypothetical protein
MVVCRPVGLGPALAPCAVLGPLVRGIIVCRTSATGLNQIVGAR